MMGKFSGLVGLFFFGFIAIFAGFLDLVLEYPIHFILIVLLILLIKFT